MKIHSAAEMSALGQVLGEQLERPVVIELVGDVGAGKTTFTRGLARGLGIETEVTSPSFTISKCYALPDIGELIHYDFYRLDDPGIMRGELNESLKNPHSVVVIEWGGGVSDLLPKQHIRLEFVKTNDGAREVNRWGISDDLWKTCGKPVEKMSSAVDNSSKKVGKSQKPVQNSPKNTRIPFKNTSQAHQNNTQKLSKRSTIATRTSSTSIHLYLDTSTDACTLRLNDREYTRVGKYDLAEKIFTFIHEKLVENHADWQDISKITFFSGPGSFTGLRIGAAIVNALSDQLKIPLFDHHGTKHQIIIPEYGREANISAPRK